MTCVAEHIPNPGQLTVKYLIWPDHLCECGAPATGGPYDHVHAGFDL